jgi:hypothetical protein
MSLKFERCDLQVICTSRRVSKEWNVRSMVSLQLELSERYGHWWRWWWCCLERSWYAAQVPSDKRLGKAVVLVSVQIQSGPTEFLTHAHTRRSSCCNNERSSGSNFQYVPFPDISTVTLKVEGTMPHNMGSHI